MAQITLKDGGLVLAGAPSFNTANGPSAGTKPPQAMRLDLEDGVLEDILKASRNDGKGVHISFGKTVVCLEEESLLTSTKFTNYNFTTDPPHRQQVSPAPHHSSVLAQ